jgi:amino acid transporter
VASSEVGGGTQLRTSAIGFWDVVFQSITYMAPGVGLVFSIGIGIPQAGITLPLAVLIGMIACMTTAVAIGQLASHIPSAGGLYTYVARGLRPAFGFYVGWMYVGFSFFLPVFLFTLNGFLIDSTLKGEGWWTGSPGWWFWTLLTIALAFTLTYFDVRISGKSGVILGAIEIAVFVALSVYMVSKGHNSFQAFNPSKSIGGTKGIFIGAVYGVLAFIGFEAASTLGEEARDPKRTIPLGIIMACFGIGIYYVFTSYAWDVGTNWNIVKNYADTGGNAWVPMAKQYWGAGWILVFLALVNSNVACAVAALTNAARVMFSMGRAGVAPRALGKVHPHHRTPHVAVITVTIMSGVMSFLISWKFGVANAYGWAGTLFTVFAIVNYMLCCAACMRYFSGEGRAYRNVLLHIALPILGILIFIVALYSQYFSFNTLFKSTLTYPFSWALLLAAGWCIFGVGLTIVVAKLRPNEILAATQAFGGEEITAPGHDGVPETA